MLEHFCDLQAVDEEPACKARRTIRVCATFVTRD